MHRSMLQVNVKESHKAFRFYQEAFDAKQVTPYPITDQPIDHAELDIYGQVLAVSELNDDNAINGNTMQFCLDFGEGKEAIVQKAYDVLRVGAKIDTPLGACSWSAAMFSLVDRFGVDWCVFV